MKNHSIKNPCSFVMFIHFYMICILVIPHAMNLNLSLNLIMYLIFKLSVNSAIESKRGGQGIVAWELLVVFLYCFFLPYCVRIQGCLWGNSCSFGRLYWFYFLISMKLYHMKFECYLLSFQTIVSSNNNLFLIWVLQFLNFFFSCL